jgi:hypothetical protein
VRRLTFFAKLIDCMRVDALIDSVLAHGEPVLCRYAPNPRSPGPRAGLFFRAIIDIAFDAVYSGLIDIEREVARSCVSCGYCLQRTTIERFLTFAPKMPPTVPPEVAPLSTSFEITS